LVAGFSSELIWVNAGLQIGTVDVLLLKNTTYLLMLRSTLFPVIHGNMTTGLINAEEFAVIRREGA
jgi:hypothetical protein